VAWADTIRLHFGEPHRVRIRRLASTDFSLGMTAHAGGGWVNVATDDNTGRRKGRSEGMSALSHREGISMSIIDLMHKIVKEPAPTLSGDEREGQFPIEAVEFVDACLLKDLGERKTPGVLLVSSLLFWFREGHQSIFLRIDVQVDGECG
jgi:hypothetical protein